MAANAKNDDIPRSMRQIIQRKFVDDVLGAAAASSSTGWMILVMDERATRIISSALSMYDVMENRITLVEPLARNRQPFREMEVLYVASPTEDSVRLIVADFDSDSHAKYSDVHLFFLDKVSLDVMQLIQFSPTLLNRIKTFKEINLNFLSAESNVFNLDHPETLIKLYKTPSDPTHPLKLARELATMCITLNEFPIIRYQESSRVAREIAIAVQNILTDLKKSDRSGNFWFHGDNGHTERERGQLLVLDRTFDLVSPLMHDYTYQAMIHDLLPVRENVLTYKLDTNAGTTIEKTALLSDNDELWVEFRYQHIARVIASIKDRMSDIIQHNAGAALSKHSGADMSIMSMAQAIKELPEYRETMSKLSQHVQMSQKCMDSFGAMNLLTLSQLEQTMTTGMDEDGKDVKQPTVVKMLSDQLRTGALSTLQKLRLLTIFFLTHRSVSQEERRQLMTDAQLSGSEQQVLVNFERMYIPQAAVAVAQTASPRSSMFKLFKSSTTSNKAAATPEDEYSDTRHICELRTILDALFAGSLDSGKYPTVGNVVESGSASTASKSVRRQGGGTAKWGKATQQTFTGRRTMVFIAGGVGYNELRVAHEVMTSNSKEVVVGSSHLVSPNEYLRDVAGLHDESAALIAGLTKSDTLSL